MRSSAKHFRDQKYSELKQQCVDQKKLFEDPEFPATDASLFYSGPPPRKVDWRRPKELCKDPRLFVNGISSHDLHQGKLGNCWFVAACSCLALRDSLWQKVIPKAKEQEWDPRRPEKYAGIFHFNFWCFGKWIDVVVDDRLPTVNGELVFCHSKERNEFWSALLEKAYAKVAGCYEALDGGNTAEAVVDFTGAVAESIDMTKGKYGWDIGEQMRLFEDVLKAHRRGGVISCYITPLTARDFEAETAMGLIQGHAYAVTAIRKVALGDKLLPCVKSEKLFMIRLRNPWGKKEWNGAWSDESEEWANVSDKERKRMGLTVSNDGEFWMMFEDWCKNFTDVDICRLVNTSFFSIHKTWKKGTMYGAWRKNPDPLLNRSGGCFNNRATFLQNPQYIFDIKKVEDKALISLQQTDRRVHKKEGRGDNFVIGFEIFKVEDNRDYRMHSVHIQEKVMTSTYIDMRTVFLKALLKRGRYVLIPTTFSPGVETEFMLRMFTDVPSKLRELKLNKPKPACLDILRGFPKRVSQIKIHTAEGLVGRDRRGGANPFLVVQCENEKVRSAVQKGTVNPAFDTQAVFYRRNIKQPIVVQVWHRAIFRNLFLGQVQLPASPGDSREAQTLQLWGRGGQEAEEMPGRITLKVISSDDLLEL
ncbi:calpain-6 isoform X1 [Sphaerodactylus townsendi]|uniref:calpain-6 isoform X1 n=1 Tax=Sphaerodactylus townsendi TaxID=933632 RepID=UPI002025C525|nr:calpain-6 isoform X1 [Sphaerodactylus townsendi]XP_048371086.1 calpain-6 isoform X1 [Sphaerodactylus townsendi]